MKHSVDIQVAFNFVLHDKKTKHCSAAVFVVVVVVLYFLNILRLHCYSLFS